MRDLPLSNKSFEHDVVDYDPKEKIYTLKNKVTGQIITMTKERFLELVKEQKKGDS